MSQASSRRKPLVFILGFFAFFIFTFYTFNSFSQDAPSYRLFSSFSASSRTSRDILNIKTLLKNSSKCVVHPPDPWDNSISEYISDQHEKDLTCQAAKVQPELTFLDSEGDLHLNYSLIQSLSLQVECQYRSYKKKENEDVELSFSDWVVFNNTTKITTEFIEVSCQQSRFPYTRIYSNNHNQIIPVLSKNLSIKKPSVIIIVLDSVSHSNFRRNMNKTLQILTNTYNSFIFNGMTKVGDNSFNNAAAFLAGKWANSEFGDVHNYFDDHPIIWKNFQANQYRTLYAEDYPGFNLFNYLSKGFRKQPVDHYFRPFWLNVYWSYVHRRSKNLCYGNNPLHNLQLNYLSQFLQKYQAHPKFALSWFTELGHDWLNQIRYGDRDLANFLSTHSSLLEDSFVIVMSDHGHRFDSIRRTRIGRIEERLPFFSMALPKKMRSDKKLMETIRNNTEKLTSSWDVYATLHHISTFTPSTSSQPSSSLPSPIRGSSLLIPLQDRNCITADIPEEFCVCDEVSEGSEEQSTEVNIETDNRIVKKLSSDLVAHINKLLSNHTQCAQLTISKTHSASLIRKGSEDEKYRLSVEVTPSKGIFEALVASGTNGKTSIIGDIHRINKYGNQSICVNDQFLRKLCFCTSFIESTNK